MTACRTRGNTNTFSGGHFVGLGVQNNRTVQLQHHFPTTVKKPRNVARQPVNSVPDAIKSDEVCDFAKVVRNMPKALTSKAHTAINSVAMAPISPPTVKRPNQQAQT